VINVLHVTSTRYGIGGVERLLLDLSDKYDSREVEFIYANLFDDANGEGAFPSEIRRRGLNYIQIDGHGMSSAPAMAAKLRRLIRERSIDVVHLHMLKASIVGWLATRALGVPTVATRHYTEKLIAKHPLPVRRLDKTAMRGMDKIISISESVRDDMTANGIPAGKITVVHNGIDIEDFDRKAAAAGSDDRWPGKFVIGTVGSLTGRKGHRFLIEAFAKVAGRLPDAQLVIAGEGPERDYLAALAGDLGVAGRVILHGFESNIPALLRQFDVYVHPATDEPFGIAVLEAMAAKKTVIATAVDGVPEIVTDGVTGILVPARDADALANALADVDPAAYGAAARQEVEDRFSIKRTAEGYMKVYKGLVTK
jgi:glycosyltransferase involved in cell wall biosynthesis